jgi:outer membrane autotransporter protein
MSGFAGSTTDTSGAKKQDKFVGGSVGYELFLADRDFLGVAFSSLYGKSKASAQTITSDNYIFSAYGLKNFDNSFVNAAVFGGFSNNSSSRNTASGQAKGKFKGHLYGAKAVVGHQIRIQQHVITPQVGFSYFTANQKGYKENGSSDAQALKGGRSNVLNATLAAKYAYLIGKDKISFSPSLTLGVSRDLLSKATAGGGTQISSGEIVDFMSNKRRQTLLFLTPSFDVKTDSLDFKVSYTLEKGSKFIGHIGSAKVMLKF